MYSKGKFSFHNKGFSLLRQLTKGCRPSPAERRLFSIKRGTALCLISCDWAGQNSARRGMGPDLRRGDPPGRLHPPPAHPRSCPWVGREGSRKTSRTHNDVACSTRHTKHQHAQTCLMAACQEKGSTVRKLVRRTHVSLYSKGVLSRIW